MYMRVSGGRAIYGVPIGILMLDARFPRIPGDMGNALTWPFPVHYRIVRDASPDAVVRGGAKGLYQAFLDAANEMVADGVAGITTNCGFLSIYQRQLARDLDVPVATSSLMQVPWIEAMLPPGKRCGILTISKASMTKAHLEAVGIDPATPVAGTDAGREFTRAILDNELELDVELARADNVEAARALCQANADLGAMVLECTNMVPYAADIADATGLPVYSIYTMIHWFQAGLQPRRFQLRP